MKKKLFAISAALTNDFRAGPFQGDEALILNRYYMRAIETVGAIPIILPPIANSGDIGCQLEAVDLLLISGGSDLDPELYGEEPSPLLDEVWRERDLYEIALVRAAAARGIPIFGICRGLQLINVAFGGTLYQDLSMANASVAHRQKSKCHLPSHTIAIESSSLLGEILTTSNLRINSYHHQAVKDIAPGFVVSARAKDGIVEGIERGGSAPILAVQWHPELMAVSDPVMLKLFKYFVNLVPHQLSLEELERVKT
jgi:putative glutamine amidotransferase